MGKPTDHRRENICLAGGMLGAMLASSCCIAPLLFVALGVSGTWIAHLTVVEPYKWLFIVIAALFFGLGFYHVYFRPRPACEDGTICARSARAKLTRAALWIGSGLAVLAASVDWWAPYFY